MFFELTELFTCPHCGPEHGLVLLVREVEGRRVISGWLGCPNCGRDFPVQGGVADLRLEDEGETGEAPVPFQGDELAVKIAALSGLTEGPGHLLLGRRLAHAATAVAELLTGVEVIALLDERNGEEERPGVSRVLVGPRLPLAVHRLRAVAIAPGDDREQVGDAALRIRANGRLLLFDAGESSIEEVERAGLVLLAREGRTAVAERRASVRGGPTGTISLKSRGKES